MAAGTLVGSGHQHQHRAVRLQGLPQRALRPLERLGRVGRHRCAGGLRCGPPWPAATGRRAGQATVTEQRRRRVEMALGALWLIDGALQFQPYMFSRQFFAGVLGMANMGLPGFLSRIDYNVSTMLAAHPTWWNAAFAALQVAIGAGLLWGRGRVAMVARTASILWGIGVWLVGEGAGALFMGGTSLLTGAPGPALLYSVLTVSIWPVPAGTAKARAVELSGPGRLGAGLDWERPSRAAGRQPRRRRAGCPDRQRSRWRALVLRRPGPRRGPRPGGERRVVRGGSRVGRQPASA